MVYSATSWHAAPTPRPTRSSIKQAMFVVIGLGVMAVAAFIDYRTYPRLAWVLYGGMVPAAVARAARRSAARSTAPRRGSSSGRFQLQPSEFAKLALIVALGALLAEWTGDIDLRRLGIARGAGRRPDGADHAPARPRHRRSCSSRSPSACCSWRACGAATSSILVDRRAWWAWSASFNSSVLEQYQKDRLTAFLNPNSRHASARPTT